MCNRISSNVMGSNTYHTRLITMNPIEAPLHVIVDELKTILEYLHYREESPCPKCQKVISEIIDDEWRHVGSALHLAKGIDPRICDLIKEGMIEAKMEINGTKPMIDDIINPGDENHP